MLGQNIGTENVTLNVNELPAHSHDVNASDQRGDSLSPASMYPSEPKDENDLIYKGTADVTMNSAMIRSTGGGAGHPNMQPSKVINFIIALVGVFPSQP